MSFPIIGRNRSERTPRMQWTWVFVVAAGLAMSIPAFAATLEVSNVSPASGTALSAEIKNGVLHFYDTVSFRVHWSFQPNESLIRVYSGYQLWYEDASDWDDPIDDTYHEPETSSGSYDFFGVPTRDLEGITRKPIKVRFGTATLGAWNTPVVQWAGEYSIQIGEPPATVTLVRPAGDETWTAGTTETIQWSYTGDPGTAVRLELLQGTELDYTIATNVPVGSEGSGLFNWTIPVAQEEGEYRIRLTTDAVPSYSSLSRPFTIAAQSTARLAVSPESRTMGPAGGSARFAVTNEGEETLSWSASVLEDGADWLTIVQGEEGIDAGAIVVACDENEASSSRTGTIEVNALGARPPQVTVTVTQTGSTASEGGHVYGVIVGVSDTASSVSAAGDAQAVWDSLAALDAWEEDASTLVSLELNTMKSDELRDEIEEAVANAQAFAESSAATSNDLFIFYYSGLGAVPEEDADEGESLRCYETADSCYERTTDDYWPSAGAYISDDELSGLFVGADTGAAEANPVSPWDTLDKLFIFDCAYAGGWWGETDGEHDLDLQRLGEKTAFLGAADETSPALVSRAQATSGRGIFSLALESALARAADGFLVADRNTNGKLTFGELYAAIEEEKDVFLPEAGEAVGYKDDYVLPIGDVSYDGQWQTEYAAGSEFEMYVDTTAAPVTVVELDPPALVRASDGTYMDRVRVSWTAVEKGAEYRVYRSLSTEPYTESPISDWISDTSFDDFLVYQPPQETLGCYGTAYNPRYYYYSVKVRNSTSESTLSNPDRGHRGDSVWLNVIDKNGEAPSQAAAIPVSALPSTAVRGDGLLMVALAAILLVAGRRVTARRRTER